MDGVLGGGVVVSVVEFVLLCLRLNNDGLRKDDVDEEGLCVRGVLE